jgi:hypothetical protein
MQGFARAYDLLAPDGPSGERIKTGNQASAWRLTSRLAHGRLGLWRLRPC